MDVHVDEWVTMYKHCEMRAPLRYDEPQNCVSVSLLCKPLGMDILYIPKMEDGYHPLVVATAFLSGGESQDQ